MWWRRKITDKFAALRRRMISETEIGLLIGMRFPEKSPRIPTIEVGTGSFDPDYARAYWERRLGDLSALEEFAERHDELYDPDYAPLYDPAAEQE